MSSNASVAAVVRQRVLSSGEKFWTPQDFEGHPPTVNRALSRLARAGELRRVRRGLYWRGASTMLGMSVPSVARVVEQLIDPAGVGPAGPSAALELGLSTQHPAAYWVAVPGRPPRPIKGVRFVDRSARTARADQRLSRSDVAVLEVVEEFEAWVELPAEQAIVRLCEIIDQTASAERLAASCATEPPVVRERLRKLLTHAGYPDAAAGIRVARSVAARQRALSVEALLLTPVPAPATPDVLTQEAPASTPAAHTQQLDLLG